MRFKEITECTVAGAIAPVESAGFVKMKTRGPVVYGDTTPQDLVKKKKKGQYSNSISEGKQVDEARLEEEDKIIAVGKGSKLKTGLHGKDEQPKLGKLKGPFKGNRFWVVDGRGHEFCECQDIDVAPIIAKALNAYAIANESVEQGVAESIEDTRKQANLKKKIDKGTATPEQKKEYEALKARNMGKKQGVDEGAKVDRMVKHIEKSEKKLGKSNKEAENIAWATANKRGMLDNKNKKKAK